ncbi:PSP1 domain-containing protein [Thermovibrio ammonificans]|jgi:cell fate regulator YaaT (PSP1 superfamily)|uniref:PSP1 domain protein n=1 Tax=Thermovibrio ammonificans (strain DSM 15698 / JCM 12110 / HB-1) TaxID=648996 RepID=E8T551_THEA1|nr:regulatory iron-sulfur-containing complex subunit RicT [Thermovibrio ammonificans]ADU96389.1 PSP1 domain protein [Thermovibrio ammonificans HB-1]
MTQVIKFKYPDTEKVGLAKSKEELLPLNYGDWIVVRTDRGEELVKVLKVYELDKESMEKFGVKEEELYQALRRETAEDRNRFVDNELFAQDALEVCKRKVLKHGLEMKLVKAYTTLKRERIVFYFTAKSRVDFRQLVRDLASHFRTRIELQQIGVRDEVKMIGAVGMCGRVCCCKEFLECFSSISLNMAKLQGLPPNPAKLSGTCGRLMCCLKFEEANYYIRQFLPEVGQQVETPEGAGTVVDINVPLETVVVEVPEKGKVAVPLRLFVTEEQWEEYVNKLKEKADDRIKCFFKAGVIGDENHH